MCAGSLLIAGGAAAAGAATTPGWRVTAVLRPCGDDSLSSVVATGPRDAWALGQPQFGSGGAGCGADVERWDGTAWHRIPVPASVALGGSLTPALAATSAGDAWIFPVMVTNVGLSYFAYNYALHWNGKAWHASAFPAKLVLQSAADLGAGDVWAFGVIVPSAGTTVPTYIPPQPAADGALLVSLANPGPYPVTIKSVSIIANGEPSYPTALNNQTGPATSAPTAASGMGPRLTGSSPPVAGAALRPGENILIRIPFRTPGCWDSGRSVVSSFWVTT